MNFTEEYIKLCDDDKIQSLKKNLEWGDWIYYPEQKQKSIIIKAKPGIEYNEINYDYIWIPTGDQLDREITEICEKRRYDYTVDYEYDRTNEDYIWKVYIIGDVEPVIIFISPNPLIAKITILIKLLEERI